ncbi:ABC transporter permease [Microvirga alba]|uniref:ABC transporter permease n=1 Tax=Microvirga alba TaxID=2791025 RepID=A0A931FQ04_9HYPH|nr:ABC transporter permease [Microvirga alba]MBF9235489.1 ABC transporter permease [Microvirga alba]
MTAYLTRRLCSALAVLFSISLISFMLLKLSGDLATALAGEGSNAAYVDFLRKEYGLDRPLLVQYATWLGRALTGDLGRSFYFGEPVSTLFAARLPVTLQLGVLSIVVAITLALPLGIYAALKEDSLPDRVVQLVALSGQAMPVFWSSYLLILLFALNFKLLPISGAGSLAHLIMPSLALALNAMPALIRITRSGMSDALASDYVRTARAKGLRSHTVVVKHALRNALVPLVAIAAVQFGLLLGGSVVVETIFAIDGIGYFTWQAISQNDYPVVQAAVLIVASFYVLLTLAADLLNMWVDPRFTLGLAP